MRIIVDQELLYTARCRAKLRKLISKMKECMDNQDIADCLKTTKMVLRLLPDHLKEGLIDEMLRTIDVTRENLERDGEPNERKIH